MKIFKIKLIVLLLVLHFLKELVWLTVIPIWHFPDEEQHFAQVAFFAEKNRFPQGYDLDVSKEIDLSSGILGTKRDKRGINNFTYHPEYRISYSKNQLGIYEKEIESLNTKENRQTMVKGEAARYGPVFYFLSAIPYKIFYQNNLLVRVFASRLVSVILSTITVLVAYLIAKEIFKKELLVLALTFLVAFQPMFSFVSAGVNSDNLFNLTFSLILYSSLKIFFRKKIKLEYLILLAFSIILGFYTKKQIFIAFPIVFFGFLINFLKKKGKIKKQHFLFLGLLIISLLFLFKKKIIRIPEYGPNEVSRLKETFPQYIFWHLKHTVAETIPWYWGVFNWLGVTLPRWFLKVQARILLVSGIGILFYCYKQIRKKIFFDKNNLKIIFLLSTMAIYYFSIIIWDYFFRKGHSFSFGIQGRYFFPTIVPHMLAIILGLITLIPKALKIIFIKIFTFWWLILSLVGLYTATTAYYQLWPINVFLNQASQYKPIVFKAAGISFFVILFFISCFWFYDKIFKEQ